VEAMADFEAPWAMAVLPQNRGLLVTEKAGRLLWWTGDGPVQEVTGGPTVSFAGQGGLGDVVLSPTFARDRMVYLSWAEEGAGGLKGAAVGRGRLSADGQRLEGFTTIWRASPFVTGNGHFGHRIAFGPDGMLYISTGDRQKFEPAQDRTGTLGKILRLNLDGSVPRDNPFAAEGGVTAQIWALGVRNPLGIAFDDSGRLWEIEMGPMGGDELNLITRGGNYGYPNVSNGRHYPNDRGGGDIPDHSAGDGFVAPQLWWTPVISPAGLMIYRGRAFPEWRGDAFIPALSGQGLLRVDLDGARARPGDRWAMGARIRAVAEGPDGAIWLLEDGRGTSQGRLLRLSPRL
jgi:aldose sugar dehydrogenase